MKKYLLIIAAAMIIGAPTAMKAQDSTRVKRPHLTKEEIVQNRTNQMEKTLMLDDATTAKFAPLYSQYLTDLMNCRPERPEMGKRGEKPKMDAQTDEQIEKMIQSRFEQSQKILDIRKSYYAKFRKILTPKQILKIYDSERDNAGKFKNEMQRRGNGHGGFDGHPGQGMHSGERAVQQQN